MKIELKPYTRERCHLLYKIYQPDPLMTYDVYAYDQDKMDQYYDSKVMDDSRKFFAIVHENRTIGEIQLKYIDDTLGQGILSIIIANDDYKNCGAGTAAINMMLVYAKENLKFKRVFADAIHRNTRSQHVLESIGFKFIREDEHLKYYEYSLMAGCKMDYIEINKKAWEYDAYNFWVTQSGEPEVVAQKYRLNPKASLKKYAQYFEVYQGLKVANICGSSGKKAIPLSLLGSDVTVFDISEHNKRYACEVAEKAGTQITYIVGDVLTTDMATYGGTFDVIFFEGGVLHYFHDINEFMTLMNKLLKPEGKMICSDFHPFTKMSDTLALGMPTMGYFSTDIIESEMAHAKFYPAEKREQMPRCSLRKYTMSEVINAIIRNGFNVQQLDEHPSWLDARFPGEFTVVAIKI